MAQPSWYDLVIIARLLVRWTPFRPGTVTKASSTPVAVVEAKSLDVVLGEGVDVIGGDGLAINSSAQSYLMAALAAYP